MARSCTGHSADASIGGMAFSFWRGLRERKASGGSAAIGRSRSWGSGDAFRNAEPRGQCLGFMEGEECAAAGFGVQQVGEPRFDTGALVKERQGA